MKDSGPGDASFQGPERGQRADEHLQSWTREARAESGLYALQRRVNKGESTKGSTYQQEQQCNAGRQEQAFPAWGERAQQPVWQLGHS